MKLFKRTQAFVDILELLLEIAGEAVDESIKRNEHDMSEEEFFHFTPAKWRQADYMFKSFSSQIDEMFDKSFEDNLHTYSPDHWKRDWGFTNQEFNLMPKKAFK